MAGVSFRLMDRLGFMLLLLFSTVVLVGCSQLYPVDPATHLVFQDDFIDPRSGWRVQAEPAGSMGYETSIYWMMVQSPHTNLVSALPKSYWFPENVDIEVEARKLSGPNDNRYGVICRYQDDLNYYWFVISSDGYYGIGKVKAGQVMGINQEQMPPSEVIQQNESWNRLRATCIGNTLTLYINGVLVDVKQDNDFTGGDIGLLAGSGAAGQLTITFDRLLVKEAQGK